MIKDKDSNKKLVFIGSSGLPGSNFTEEKFKKYEIIKTLNTNPHKNCISLDITDGNGALNKIEFINPDNSFICIYIC